MKAKIFILIYFKTDWRKLNLDAKLPRLRYWPRFDDLNRVASVIPYMDFDHATLVDKARGYHNRLFLEAWHLARPQYGH